MKTDKFSIIQGDCFELIKEVKTNSVDLILTDPPYNLAKHSTGEKMSIMILQIGIRKI